MKRPRLDPATRAKLHRFRSLRRAWWSFWLLLFLFGLSLVSELLVNGQPLLVWYQNQLYAPILRTVPQHRFLADGVRTEPDYHDLAHSPLFAKDSGNWMLWTFGRYGPRNFVKPEHVEIDPILEMRMFREQRVGYLRLQAGGILHQLEDAAWAFSQPLTPGEPVPLPEPVAQAVASRFANQTSPELSYDEPGTARTWHLSAFDARRSPPRSLRVLLRERVSPAGGVSDVLRMTEGGDTVGPVPAWAAALTEEQRAALDAQAAAAFAAPVAPIVIELDDGRYRVEFLKETVQFPFRPVRGHPMGLDSSGRDVLGLILYATRISLLFGFTLVVCSILLGTLLGALQGYYGGWLDLIGQRLIEIWESLPFLYIMILMGSIFGKSFLLLLLVYAVFNWVGISYYQRAEFLKLRSQPFTEAARALGLPASRIMWRHILPNALVPLITFFPFMLVGAISSLSGLDYLGFGLPPGTPSWGQLLHQGQSYRYAWWLILYPSLALFLCILLCVFIGEGLRNAFDPKRETHWEA